MTKREAGFLLIGLGFGLMFAIAVILEVLLSLYKTAFITAYNWDKGLLLAPVILLAIGLALILHRPRLKQINAATGN
jgi:asparagine N-glycosylation enzyme membrane subunit Stt3